MRSASILLLSASCAATDASSGDGGGQGARLELVFQPSGEPSGVALEAASARFEEIRFVGDTGEDLEAGTTSLDLLAQEPPAVVLTDAPPGLYSRVRLRLGPDDRDTLRVDGVFMGTPVELRARDEDEIDLRCPEGQRLDPGGAVTLVVDVDRGRWFSGVDLSAGEVVGGVLHLDPDEEPNRELAETVFEQILGSFSIHGVPQRDGGFSDGGVQDDAGPDDGGEDGEDDGGGGPDDGGGE